jgi:WD40 repeat protein
MCDRFIAPRTRVHHALFACALPKTACPVEHSSSPCAVPSAGSVEGVCPPRNTHSDITQPGSYMQPALRNMLAAELIDIDLENSCVDERRKTRAHTVLGIADARQPPTNKSMTTIALARKLGPSHKHRHTNDILLRALDAPGMLDDFYSKLVDWSVHDLLAVGLGTNVHVTQPMPKQSRKVISYAMPQEEIMISSLAWSPSGKSLAVGNAVGTLCIVDAHTGQIVRHMDHLHTDRISNVAWHPQCAHASSILATSSRDRMFRMCDLRVRNAPMATIGACIKGHTSEVCGLQWNSDGRMLATGGNDNTVRIWSTSRLSPTSPMMVCRTHKAAIKAIAWSPSRYGVLATGGGTSDGHIHCWSMQGSLEDESACHLGGFDAGSQVSSLIWSRYRDELASSHGFRAHHVRLWSNPLGSKVSASTSGLLLSPALLESHTSHTGRIITSVAAPDGVHMLTASGADQTLRVWRMFTPAVMTHYSQWREIDSQRMLAKCMMSSHIIR